MFQASIVRKVSLPAPLGRRTPRAFKAYLSIWFLKKEVEAKKTPVLIFVS